MAKYNRHFLFPEMCSLLISSDAETALRQTARVEGEEGVDEECPRMLSEGVAPKEGREPVREVGGGRDRAGAVCLRQQ